MAYVELAKYKLLPDADPNVLIGVEQEIQREIGPKHPGYIGRELLRAADGSYVLIMRWKNQELPAHGTKRCSVLRQDKNLARWLTQSPCQWKISRQSKILARQIKYR